MVNLNSIEKKQLHDEGWFPGNLGDLWIGDKFVWDHPDRYSSSEDPATKTFIVRTVLDVKLNKASFTDEDGNFVENTIVNFRLMNPDGSYDYFSASTACETFILQAEINKRDLGNNRAWLDAIAAKVNSATGYINDLRDQHPDLVKTSQP